MGLFNSILEKLGFRKPDQQAVKPPTAGGGVSSKPSAPIKQYQRPPVNINPRAMAEVDVVKKLEQLSVGKGLNWKVSIVDLLKLLDIDSSREARNELATELGCPANLMSDSAKMNVWLHKEVLRRIAVNGGNIPQNLLT